MTLTKTVVAKLAVAFVAISMMAFAVAPAQAQTVEELQAQIDALMAQISALSGGSMSTSSACPYTWTRSLTQGDTGADVMALQKFLNGSADTKVAVSGAGSTGSETSFYGPATAAAVSNFQVKYRTDILSPVGLVNATGYFGPSTMAKANALCVSSTGTGSTGTGSTVSGDLQGGAGSIKNADFIGSLNNEEVGEGQTDVEVAGLTIEADDGSDIELTAVKANFAKSTGATSNFYKYADEVSVWVDGVEYARMDAREFTTTNGYDRTISLDRGAIIKAGEKGELVIAISGISNIDSSDAGDTWTVALEDLRYRDAQGATVTDSSTGDIASTRSFTFESFATASAMKFKVRSGDSAINSARTIEVSSTTKMTNEQIISFEVTVDGDSNMNLDELTVDATTTGTTLAGVISTADLYMDGTQVGSEAITSAFSTYGQITFNNLNLDLTAGKTYEFVVKVDFQKATGAFTTGSTLNMDVSSADVASTTAWILEDENGDTVVAADRSGSASADTHTLVTAGVLVALGDTTAVEVTDANSTSKNYGKFTMNVEVTAIGDTIYMLETAASSTVASSTVGLAYVFEDTTGAQISTASSTSGSFSHVSGGTVDGSSIRIDEGQTATFQFVGTYDPTSAGQLRTRVVGVGFGTTSAGTGSSQTASPVSDFRSGNVYINN